MRKHNDPPRLRAKKFREHVRAHRGTFVVYLVLRLIVIAGMVLSILHGNYENLFVYTLSLVLFMIPSFVEETFGIDIPSTLEIIVLLFIFCAEVLGELQAYYLRFPYWDTMLHTVNGFLCAAVGFALVDILNRNEKIKFHLSPIFLAVVAFCFSMTVGVIWEFFEFGCDWLFHTDMQKDTIINTIASVTLDPTKSNTAVVIDNITQATVNGKDLGLGGYLDIGLYDTMKDLFVNFIGALVFSVIGFFYVKGRGKGKFAKRFIPTLKPQPPKKKKEDNHAEETTASSS